MSVPALRIDFRARANTRFRVAAWFALAISVAAMIALLQSDERMQRDLDAAQERVDSLQGRVVPGNLRRSSRAATPEEARQIQRANAVIDELALPWDGLFRAVEAADARGLGLLALAPDPHELSVRINGEAHSLTDVLAYADRLGAQPRLGGVHLLGFETVTRDGAQVVSFTLAAKWQAR